MILHTDRLILRPFAETDAEDVFEYLHEPAVNCFACMKLDALDDAKAEMKKRVGETEYYFAIVLKDSGKVIGEIDAYPECDDPQEDANAVKDTFSPCWMLNLNYTGKGYAFEAAHAFFDYLFNAKGARRIYAYTEDYNKPSQHLCEKLGMRQEGLFKEFISFVKNPDGTPKYENTYQYAILKKEWESLRQSDNKHIAYKGTLIVVRDCRRALRFYNDMFGLELVQDNDGNMELTEHIYLQESRYWTEFTQKSIIAKSNQSELYFEAPEIEKFIARLEELYPETEYVNRLMTHSWGQKTVRFYDPDGNLIEVGTPV